ncbi:MAG: NAD(P)/FAD-dependent oxidoreductase [Micavibrio sp.]
MSEIAIIGGGPAGLMAAEVIASAGHAVTVYERKPTPGRKFLMAGRGGLNLTHSEEYEPFIARYGRAAEWLAPVIQKFPPSALQDWCEGLGQPTFVGTSGRIFPESLKASPLLRAWKARLDQLGVRFVFQQDWTGWDADGSLLIADEQGQVTTIKPDATILALGGASWPKLGSDGGWVAILKAQGIPVTPLRPANCGFAVAWSDHFRERFAGQPLKPVTLRFAGKTVQGEVMITANGVEGGAIYALSAALRDEIDLNGAATMMCDLRPGLSAADLVERLQTPRGSQSLSTYLQKSGGLSPVAINLIREVAGKDIPDQTPHALAQQIKNLPLTVTAPFPLDRAISTAGGIPRDAFDDHFMLRARPGVFVAGEMLDWEAPTGGYLLQATFSTAVAAANGVLDWLTSK